MNEALAQPFSTCVVQHPIQGAISQWMWLPTSVSAIKEILHSHAQKHASCLILNYQYQHIHHLKKWWIPKENVYKHILGDFHNCSIIYFETNAHSAVSASLKLLGLSNPLASASQSAWDTGVCHHTSSVKLVFHLKGTGDWTQDLEMLSTHSTTTELHSWPLDSITFDRSHSNLISSLTFKPY